MHKDINVNVSGPMQPTSTYKTVVLKGNHSFASQVTEPNTKYVIKHNFDLGGGSVTIPENCVLEFEGGSISNGLILGDKMPTTEIYTPEQFGAGKTSDDTKAIQSALNLCKFIRMDGNYNVYSSDDSTNWYPALWIKSDTDIELNGIIHLKSTQYTDYNILFLKDVSNIIIRGNGKIEGDKLIHTAATSEHGACIGIYRSNNITVVGIELYNANGDGIDINWREPKPSNIVIKNIYVHDVRRMGLAIAANNVYVNNVRLENCFGAHQSSSGIDIENDSGNAMNNIVIDTAYIKNCNLGIAVGGGNQMDNVFLRNITVVDNDDTYHSPITINQPCVLEDSVIGDVSCFSDATIRNCSIKDLVGLTKKDSINTTIIDNCIVNGSFGRNEGSGVGGIVEVIGSTINIPNNEEFFNMGFVAKFKFYNSEINFNSSYSNTCSGIEAYNCMLSTEDAFDFSISAYNSVFKAGLEGSNHGVFFPRNNGINLFSCLIELGNRNTPLFRLNARGDLRVLDCTIIDPLTNRDKTYGSDHTLTEAANIYIKNNQVSV